MFFNNSFITPKYIPPLYFIRRGDGGEVDFDLSQKRLTLYVPVFSIEILVLRMKTFTSFINLLTSSFRSHSFLIKPDIFYSIN